MSKNSRKYVNDNKKKYTHNSMYNNVHHDGTHKNDMYNSVHNSSTRKRINGENRRNKKKYNYNKSNKKHRTNNGYKREQYEKKQYGCNVSSNKVCNKIFNGVSNKKRPHECKQEQKCDVLTKGIDPKKILPLENKWTLWFHKKDNREWGQHSFIKIYEITTVQNFWQVYNNIPIFDTELFFLMKNDVFPRWEDPNNCDGGTWNIKICRNYANDIWINLCLLLIGETMSKQMETINGISIRPKFANSIIKIWVNYNEVESGNKSFINNYNMPEFRDILGKDFDCNQINFTKFS